MVSADKDFQITTFNKGDAEVVVTILHLPTGQWAKASGRSIILCKEQAWRELLWLLGMSPEATPSHEVDK